MTTQASTPESPGTLGTESTERAPARWQTVTAAIFMVEFLLIYNPFASLSATQRFPAIAIVPALAWAYSHRFRSEALGWFVPRRFTVFIGFMLITSFRTNPVVDENGVSVLTDNMIQFWLTVHIIVGSLFVYRIVGREAFLRSVRWYSTGIALYLAVVTGLDLDWFRGARSGDFNQNTYQQLGEVLAVSIISQVVHIRALATSGRLSIFEVLLRAPIMVAFLYMVMQNEARGETIALVVALTVIALPRLSVIVGVIVLFFPLQIASIFSSLGFNGATRLVDAAVQGDLGLRDKLLLESWDLLRDPQTLLIGRGSNYFQFHYGYHFGLYPHNTFVEAAIVGGAIGFLIVCWTYLVPILRGYLAYVAGAKVDLASLSLCIYFVLVSAKSGSLAPGWSIGLFAPLFVSLAHRKTVFAARDHGQPRPLHADLTSRTPRPNALDAPTRRA